MKKLVLFFSVLIGMAANVTRAEITATPVFPAGYLAETPEIAMTVDEDNMAVMQRAMVYESGRDVEVVIFGEKFTVEKQFTLHDVVTERDNNGSYVSKDYVSLYNLSIKEIDSEVMVSRNFFVKNNKWCVVLRYSTGSYPDGVRWYKVMDEDGNLLGEIPEMSKWEWANILLDGLYKGTPYLFVGKGSGFGGETCQLYTFTGTGQSGIEPVKVAALSRAYPNPLPSGQTFNVELSKPADEATFFSVVDMNGRQVLRRKIPFGESCYRLSGSRFGRGHYVYTVIYKDGESVTGRLMAE